ncbi:RING finger protein 112-like [Protopterus annectens]|uniref:RING finger protein 112-like n=1 Tax=Protopterus annectens TaxID=7888 RepID=UPI001CF97A6D|nr:RING finger protein 112-like [Protopterus annectens]
MKTTEYGFSSPLEMAITLNNRMELENIRNQFHEILQQEEKNSDNFVKILKTMPKEMKEKLELSFEDLLALCKNKLEGDEKKKQEFLNLLSNQLQEDLENYISGYEKKFKTSAIKAGCAVGAVGIGLAGAVVGAGMATGALLSAGAAAVAVGAVAKASSFGRRRSSRVQTREYVLRKKNKSADGH